MHRQRRDDRLGRRGTAGARPHRPARYSATRAMAARRSDQARAAGELFPPAANRRWRAGRIMSLDRVTVLGAGAWGSALANVAARAGRRVTLWARDPKAAAAIDKARENP